MNLQKGLSSILRKRTLLDTPGNDGPYTRIFESYKSSNEQKLKNESVQKLSRLVNSLPSGEGAKRFLTEFEHMYTENVYSFWEIFPPLEDRSDLSIIRYLSESFTRLESNDPIRRRIGLSVLFERVQSEKRRLQASCELLRTQTLKGVTNNKLLDSLWGRTDKMTKKKFIRHVRAGEKWASLEPGVLVGFSDHHAWTL